MSQWPGFESQLADVGDNAKSLKDFLFYPKLSCASECERTVQVHWKHVKSQKYLLLSELMAQLVEWWENKREVQALQKIPKLCAIDAWKSARIPNLSIFYAWKSARISNFSTIKAWKSAWISKFYAINSWKSARIPKLSIIMPESVLHVTKRKKLISQKVTKNSVIYHNVCATLWH